MKQLARISLVTSMLIIGIATIAMLVSIKQADALVISNESPSSVNSNPDGVHVHFLRVENGGVLRTVRLAAYYPASTSAATWNALTLQIRPGGSATNSYVCNAGTNTGVINGQYVRVTLSAVNGGSSTYYIRRANVCNALGSPLVNNSLTHTLNNQFYGSYALGMARPSAPDGVSGLYKVNVTIHLDDNIAQSTNTGIRFFTRLNGTGARMSMVGLAGSPRTYPVLGDWAGPAVAATGNQQTSIYIPFGVKCNASAGFRELRLYDADNGASFNNVNNPGTGYKPSYRITFRILSTDAPAHYVPLTIINPGSGDVLTGGNTVFVQRDGDAITSRIRANLEPKKHYQLEITGIHLRNYIDFGFPDETEGLFGDTSYTCPAVNPTLTPATSIDGTDIEEGTPFTARASVTNNSTTAATGVGASWNVWLARNNDGVIGADELDLSAPNIANQSIAASGGRYDATPFTRTAIAGYAYVCSQLTGFTSTNGAIFTPNPLAHVCKAIVKKPFVKVTNGDVNAAAALQTGSGCSLPGTLPTISTFNKEDAPTYSGSGTNIAAFAAGTINEFISGIKPKGLTFANVGSGAGSSNYGGGFGEVYCIPNYWAGITVSTDQIASAGSNTSIFTTGNVSVTGSPSNATFDLNNNTLRWVVADTIYIDKDVENLDGIYIARNKIVTCATGFSAANGIAECGKALTVNGALVAGQGVLLKRLSGTLSTTPAETFVYSPDVWLQALVPNSQVAPAARGSLGKWQSITLLPPIL